MKFNHLTAQVSQTGPKRRFISRRDRRRRSSVVPLMGVRAGYWSFIIIIHNWQLSHITARGEINVLFISPAGGLSFWNLIDISNGGMSSQWCHNSQNEREIFVRVITRSRRAIVPETVVLGT